MLYSTPTCNVVVCILCKVLLFAIEWVMILYTKLHVKYGHIRQASWGDSWVMLYILETWSHQQIASFHGPNALSLSLSLSLSAVAELLVYTGCCRRICGVCYNAHVDIVLCWRCVFSINNHFLFETYWHISITPLTSNRHHLSYDDCLENKWRSQDCSCSRP